MQRRVQHDLLFLSSILRGRVDTSTLLRSFSLHVSPRSTRTVALFTVPRARVRTVESGMFCRIPKAMNAFLVSCTSADIFHDRLAVFRAQVLRYVLTL